MSSARSCRSRDDEFEDVEIEVADDDVLEVAAEERVAEPMIYERTAPSAAPVIDDEPAPKRKKKAVLVTEVNAVVPGVSPAELAPEPAKPARRARMAMGTAAPEPADDEVIALTKVAPLGSSRCPAVAR